MVVGWMVVEARARQEAAFLCRRMFANGLLRHPLPYHCHGDDDDYDEGDDEDADEYRSAAQ